MGSIRIVLDKIPKTTIDQPTRKVYAYRLPLIKKEKIKFKTIWAKIYEMTFQLKYLNLEVVSTASTTLLSTIFLCCYWSPQSIDQVLTLRNRFCNRLASHEENMKALDPMEIDIHSIEGMNRAMNNHLLLIDICPLLVPHMQHKIDALSGMKEEKKIYLIWLMHEWTRKLWTKRLWTFTNTYSFWCR